jgi:outer membrane assembly lipoprotein YfiO
MILKRFSLLICFLTIFNCSSNDNEVDRSLANNQETADLMYVEAMNKFNAKKLNEAIIIFEEIERLYPLSNEAIQSQIMSGFIDYANLNYDDAIYKFSRIINKYPSLKNIDYVYYMKALCYYEQISHEELDGQNNYLALENLEQLIIRFPDSKYAKDGRQKSYFSKFQILLRNI